ncbi:hypothetical protein [Candidatus Venteria ishoeyi]|uniref:hypothetical protein n=1 Tax=Candidatus Venteria ishoeyi TaxID=1899563 RepID=UPI000CDEE55C|nr:hypothetical protein [Candidatus Venteria ishoeyi]
MSAKQRGLIIISGGIDITPNKKQTLLKNSRHNRPNYNSYSRNWLKKLPNYVVAVNPLSIRQKHRKTETALNKVKKMIYRFIL